MISQMNLAALGMLLLSQADKTAGQPPIWGDMVFLGLMGVALIAFTIIPANKRRKEQENMINSLQKGDKVLCNSGILGEIIKIDNNLVTLKIADKVNIQMLKSQIAGRYDPDKKTSADSKENKAAADSAEAAK